MKSFMLIALITVSYLLTGCSGIQSKGELRTNESGARSLRELHSQIERIIDTTLRHQCVIGVTITSLDDSMILYEKNSDIPFHPASNMKLLTTATGLNVLSPEFEFTNQVFTDGEIKDSVLHGNLAIKGSGDPLLKANDIDSLASLIRGLGIQAITGDIVGDVTYFDVIAWGSGWMWDDEPEAYQPFISPLSLNSNAIEVSVNPGVAEGESLAVALNPPTSYFEIINTAVASSDTLIPWLTVTRQRGTNRIVVQGRIPPKAGPQKFNLSVLKPEMFLLTILKEALTRHGVAIGGSVHVDTIARSFKLASLSHPLDSVLHEIDKVSDNLGAENLLKTIAAEKFRKSGTSANGLRIVKEFLISARIDTTNINLADGSGLSSYNLITPNSIVKLLQYEYANKGTFHRFIECLPIAGVDGTLKNRMKGTRAAMNVRAKTGTLFGASSLSGYVTTADWKLLAFSMMTNHYLGEIGDLRRAQDKIMETLVNLKLSNL